MADVELRSKTELTSIVGTEKNYTQEAGSPFTVKWWSFNTVKSWLKSYFDVLYAPITGQISTVYKQASYAILDNDGIQRIEADTTTGAATITLPLMANNRGRRIEIAYIKNDASADVVTISPHATDANKLSNDLLASIILSKVGDFLIVQESVNSGCWEVVNERITCELELDTYAGFGSTDDKIPRFTNMPIFVGNMFSENHASGYSSNTKGLEILIKRSGKYNVALTWADNAGGVIGLSVDSNQLTTSIATITLLHRKVISASAGNVTMAVSYSAYFKKGQIIRPHSAGVASYITTNCKMFVSYQGN